MKFVCDRCKTRYSIGDERVRGKILKIRCKNCANVITVREGMDAGPNEGDRSRPTMSVPIVTAPTASGPVVVATKAPPPPAFEEEWYVSIDGVQSGPISLAEAQRWVAGKPHDAELHCWKEGFDDWLPVEKVSHFRAHRRRPPELPPMAPPPPRKQPTVPPPLPEKPLFASTMAAIEKSATESQRMPAITSPLKPGASAPAIPAAASNGTGPIQAKGTGSATPISAGAAALKQAFSDDDDPSDSATSVGAPAFGGFDVGGNDIDAAPSTPAKKTVQQALDDDDDDLQIGEVSRVVKLADLVPKPKPANATGSVARVSQTASVARVSQPALGATGSVARISQPSLNQTGSVGRLTGNVQRLSPAELGMNVDPSLMSAQGPAPDESMVAQSFAEKHRRGLIALIGFSALLVLGVIGAVAFVVSRSTNEIGGGLGGGTKVIDTSRPEDIVRRQLPPTPGQGSGSAVATPTKPKYTGTRPSNPLVPPENPDDPKGMSLKASEIEDMAAKQGEGTKRCYMRAQKGALGFDIADVKKIAVTLQVGKDGVVNDVQLSSHGGDDFGKCLIARIKAWKFRESSSGGTFRISLAFSNS